MEIAQIEAEHPIQPLKQLELLSLLSALVETLSFALTYKTGSGYTSWTATLELKELSLFSAPLLLKDLRKISFPEWASSSAATKQNDRL